MDLLGTLQEVSAQLRRLFADKGELKGFDDWDAFIWCVAQLELLTNSLSGLKDQNGEQTTEDGEDLDGKPSC